MRTWSTLLVILVLAVPAVSSALILRLPLIEEVSSGPKNSPRYTYYSLARHNEELKKKNSKIEIPYYVEFTSSDAKEVEAKLKEVGKTLKAASKVLGKELDFRLWQSVSQYTKSTLGYRLCYQLQEEKYKDDSHYAEGVAKFVYRFAGVALSEQMNLIGARYKEEGMWVAPEFREEDQEDWPENWVNWRGNGEAVLVLNTDDDDGTHLNDDIVRSCELEDQRLEASLAKPVKKRRTQK